MPCFGEWIKFEDKDVLGYFFSLIWMIMIKKLVSAGGILYVMLYCRLLLLHLKTCMHLCVTACFMKTGHSEGILSHDSGLCVWIQ